MKAEVVPKRGTDSVDNKKSSKIRLLDISFEGKDLGFKTDHWDNGRFPHGGYKGSKRHPPSPLTFDKGREFHRQLRDDLDLEMEREEVGGLGSTPTWAVEAHRWPTHSGESPLLSHGFLSPTKLEPMNNLNKSPVDQSGKSIRATAPSGSSSGVVYYRADRAHPFLTATELRDAGELGCEEVVRYGRPTRTTLLRARQRLSAPGGSYDVRRQLEQRMEEIRVSCAMNPSPKEILQLESDVEGETLYSFLTGARYNRANCLDSRSVAQHGVYMPRHNPLGCFVVPQKLEELDTTSAPPDSPTSENAEGSKPETDPPRPTSDPGQGKKPLPASVPPLPIHPPSSNRQAWWEAHPSSSLHPLANGETSGKGENSGSTPHLEDILSPKLRVKGSRVAINSSREGPLRFEGKLPRLRILRESTVDHVAYTNQPPPTPVPAYVRLDHSSLPPVRPEPESATPDGPAPTKSTLFSVREEEKPAEEKKAEKTEEEEEEEDQKEGKDKSEEDLEQEKEREKTEEDEEEEEKDEEQREEENVEEEEKDETADEERNAGDINEEERKEEMNEEEEKEEEEEKMADEGKEDESMGQVEDGEKNAENEEEEEEEKAEEHKDQEETPQEPETETPADVTEHVTEAKTSSAAEEEEEGDQAVPPEGSTLSDATAPQTDAAGSREKSEDAKFFLTQGAGAERTLSDVTTAPNDARSSSAPGERVPHHDEAGSEMEAEAQDQDEGEQGEGHGQVEGQETELKVVVTHKG